MIKQAYRITSGGSSGEFDRKLIIRAGSACSNIGYMGSFEIDKGHPGAVFNIFVVNGAGVVSSERGGVKEVHAKNGEELKEAISLLECLTEMKLTKIE